MSSHLSKDREQTARILGIYLLSCDRKVRAQPQLVAAATLYLRSLMALTLFENILIYFQVFNFSLQDEPQLFEGFLSKAARVEPLKNTLEIIVCLDQQLWRSQKKNVCPKPFTAADNRVGPREKNNGKYLFAKRQNLFNCIINLKGMLYIKFRSDTHTVPGQINLLQQFFSAGAGRLPTQFVMTDISAAHPVFYPQHVARGTVAYITDSTLQFLLVYFDIYYCILQNFFIDYYYLCVYFTCLKRCRP